MTTADVNVTEKVAQALCPALWDDTYPEHLREGLRHLPREQATASLAALSDSEVLAGIAGVLREHGWVYTHPVTASRCACGERPDDMAGHQATAVADWLRGQG
jgi:hypothetical protein